MTDLSVKFQEPQPTVGGLTGEQLSLFRQIQAENHCWYEVFPVSPKGPAEYCTEPREPWSSYCEEHAYRVAQEQAPEQDDYDCWVDRDYEG